MMTTTNATVTVAAKASETPRTCARPECKKVLGANNRSGFCHDHHPHSKPKANGAAAARANGHTVAGKTNGIDVHHGDANHPAKEGRDGGRQQLAAERAKLLLAVIPDADKISLCLAWLRGEKLGAVGETAEQSGQAHAVNSLTANSEMAEHSC